ncbi:hypothetical protein MKK88_01170 [Methylobacterium sp. E-005]|uniref:hypothetical protein n=1 Tax=Methylobacterium sp. E-005 TaxID=2836549 RepID=UPI001FB90BF2|nr:hypothetical protein [Methylobacterium sp. E-005]MCJ2084607.1 hypothetical protein [Methylobacterium sp. E-005]
MTTPLAGSLAKTVGRAFASTFFPAVLTRGQTTYRCKAIFTEYSTGQAAEGVLTGNDCTVLILATTLAVEPISGDVVSITGARFAQGQSFVVLSLTPGKAAVVGDPAGATWTLRGRTVPLNGPGSSVTASYAALAQALGVPHQVYRTTGSHPLSPANLIGALPALFVDGGGAGFNLNRALHPDDVLQNALLDATGLALGDFLARPGTWGDGFQQVYFIASLEPMRPINAILCNRLITHLRGNSQIDADGGQGEGLPSQTGGAGRYFGYSATPDTDDVGPGERTLAANVPVALVPLAGAARGQGEVPTDAPGPGRWRMHLPVSVFPLGTVANGDIFSDEGGSRYQVATNGWTPLGYKVEMIRLEN